MNKELILLRHGKSDWAVDADDFHRPLKNRGKRGAQKIGLWLAKNNLVPDYVISSPAVRAITTAEKACKVMGLDVRSIDRDERVYMAPAKELIEVIKSCPAEVKRLMVVGHNPGLEQLLVLLANQQVLIPKDGKILPTSTLGILQTPGSWQSLSANKSNLLNLIRARELPDGFPFPDLNSNELRQRPAYYYSQSAVIPYRIVDSHLEVLIVKSSSGKRWVFPKGIIDPQLSPQDSAAKEAFEEAGVKGLVDTALLDEYYVDKWGAKCHVLVYPMVVTEIIPKNEWKEKHRNRKWLRVNEVPQYLENTTLLTTLDALVSRLHKG